MKSKFKAIFKFGMLFVIIALIISCSAKKKNDREVKILFPGNFKVSKSWMKIVNNFKKEYPDIKLNILSIPWSAYRQKLITSLGGGQPADICFLTDGSTRDFVQKNSFLGLNKYIKNDKELNNSINNILPKILLKNVNIKENIYGLPMWQNVFVLYYNKDLFDNENIKYPSSKWNWSDYLLASIKLTKKNNKTYSQFGTVLLPLWQALYIIPWQNNLQLVNDKKNVININNIKLVKSFKKYFDLYKKYKVTPYPSLGNTQVSGQTTSEMFMTGKIAMYIGQYNEIDTLRQTKNFKWGVSEIPNLFEKKSTINNSIYMCVIKAGKNNSDAIKFLKYAISLTGQKYIVLNSDMPVRKEILNSKLFLDRNIDKEYNKVFVNSLKFVNYPPLSLNHNIFRAIADHISVAILGKISFKEACKRAEKDAKREMSNK